MAGFTGPVNRLIRANGHAPEVARLREELARSERRVQEQLGQLDNWNWQFDRFYDGTFGYFGGQGRAGYGIPTDRTQDKSHAPLPYLTEWEWRTHIALARDLLARNHVFIGFRDHVRAFIGGCTVQFVRRGQSPGASSSGPVDADSDGVPDDALVAGAQQAFDEWAEVNDWGQGETDRELECLSRLLTEGETNNRFFRGEYGCVPVMRHVDPELIRTPTSRSVTDPEGWGKENDPDDAERIVRIWMCHPTRPEEVKPYPADRFVCAKVNADRTTKRGLSDFFAVAELVRKVAGLLDNMGHVARLQAAIAWWEFYSTATRAQLEAMDAENRAGILYPGVIPGARAGANAAAIDWQQFMAGSIVKAEGGRQVLPGPVSQPAGFIQVEQAIMRSMSFRFGLPSSFTGDGADSFASALVTGSPFVRIIEGRQRQWQGFCREVAMKVLTLCEESGRLPKGTCREVRPVCTSKPVVIADEEKQARTWLALFDKGLADPYEIIKKRGGDPKVVLANLADFRRKMAEQSGAQGGGQGGGGSPWVKVQRDDGTVYYRHGVTGATAGAPNPGPNATPPGSAGGDGSSPSAESFGGDGFAVESLVREEAPGPPPRPGLVWHGETHRWRNPETGEEHEPGPNGKGSSGPIKRRGDGLPDPATPAGVVAVARGLRRAMMRTTAGEPKDQCINAAHALHAVYPEAEIWSGMYGEDYHTVAKLGGRFIDVTADQFGGPKVTIRAELPGKKQGGAYWSFANTGPGGSEPKVVAAMADGLRKNLAPATESRVSEAAGKPPWPGAVLRGDPPRWHNPHTGETASHADTVATMPENDLRVLAIRMGVPSRGVPVGKLRAAVAAAAKQSPPAGAVDRPKLYRDLVTAVNAQGEEHGSGARFDLLYAALREAHPELTPAEFKGALRKLDADGHIALSGWNESTDDVPDKSLNLYHYGGDAPKDSEDLLYYHANPAAWHGMAPKTDSPEASAGSTAKAPDTSALEADPGADKAHLTALASAESDPRTKDYLEAAAHNVRGANSSVPGGVGSEGERRRRLTVDRLASAWAEAGRAGHTGAAAKLAGILKAFGAAPAGPAPGERAAFDGRTHESDAPVFTGDAVVVVRQPVVLGDYVAVKGIVKPA